MDFSNDDDRKKEYNMILNIILKPDIFLGMGTKASSTTEGTVIDDDMNNYLKELENFEIEEGDVDSFLKIKQKAKDIYMFKNNGETIEEQNKQNLAFLMTLQADFIEMIKEDVINHEEVLKDIDAQQLDSIKKIKIDSNDKDKDKLNKLKQAFGKYLEIITNNKAPFRFGGQHGGADRGVLRSIANLFKGKNINTHYENGRVEGQSVERGKISKGVNMFLNVLGYPPNLIIQVGCIATYIPSAIIWNACAIAGFSVRLAIYDWWNCIRDFENCTQDHRKFLNIDKYIPKNKPNTYIDNGRTTTNDALYGLIKGIVKELTTLKQYGGKRKSRKNRRKLKSRKSRKPRRRQNPRK
jgi:hypothetical protein